MTASDGQQSGRNFRILDSGLGGKVSFVFPPGNQDTVPNLTLEKDFI